MADVVSVLTGGSNSKTTTAEEINAPMTDLWTDGVVGTIGNTAGVAPMTGALACNAQGTPDMTVAVTAGVAYVTCTPTSQGSQRLRANIATQNATIAANSTGGTRYDWIYVAMSASGAANPAVDGTGVATITVSRSTSSATDNGTPPTYGYHIATVTVSNGAATITNGNITDSRSVVALSATNSNTGWITAEATPDTVTALGNRSYSMVFNSIDMTDTLSPGMRLKLTRTVTAPTQCTSLNGTTQYYSKATPNKMTFTDDFVCSAWIKVSSYPSGSYGGVITRFNNTSGFEFVINSAGQITLLGRNAAPSNYSQVQSYQSIPLNKWVHIAAQLDMSAFTATTTTSYVMIDGLGVPASVLRAGTNPTALIQAGNLEIGSTNGGTLLLPGKIAQAAVYSAKVTQATILASMHQTLTGSETNLASAYSFNNSITDLNTTTPNDLTPQGSAVATSADSPFAQDAQGVPVGTTEYAVITKTAFSTNTTLTVQVPEGGAIPTSGGVSALSYSTQAVPYGFISQRSKWRVIYLYRQQTPTASNATFAAVTGVSFSIPTGDWVVGYNWGVYNLTLTDIYWCLASTSQTGLAGSASDTRLQTRIISATNGATTTQDNFVSYPFNHTSATTYTMYSLGATTSAGILGTTTQSMLFAECAYI